ncbi:MAG: hypothetical protein A3C35_00330 [Omnitrophica bacterium RIFCSPHIGHO2_02_FULL_46_11]|nr:MAG: hypothetical protein A3C35_00330 [Omnitrophica bacterium RIFCSPHIGHO2_02_FULL_46_11]
MTQTMVRGLTSKWRLVLCEYEKVKSGQSRCFDSIGKLCQAYQVHRKDIRKYYERWVKSGKSDESLLPLRRGPREGLYRQLTKGEERLLVQVKRRLRTSPFETLELVKPYLPVPLSVRTVYRIFKRYPLNERRKEAIKCYEKKYPGELLHADNKGLAKTIVVDRQKHWLFGLIDDCTRLVYVEIVKRPAASEAAGACVRGMKWFWAHGIQAEEIMTDNGIEFTAFTSQKAKETHFFETTLKMFGVRHRLTRPYRPQTNGKIERFWKTLNEECLQRIDRGLSFHELKERVLGFTYRYNYERRHGAIGYQTPFEKLKKIATMLPKL